MDTIFRIEALQKEPELFYRIVSWFPSFPFRFTRVADFGQIRTQDLRNRNNARNYNSIDSSSKNAVNNSSDWTI